LKQWDLLIMTDNPTGSPLSKARRRAIKEALATLDGSVRLTPSRRHYAVHRIQQARSPKVEAKRLIQGYRQGAVALSTQPDLSDVEELRVRLIRRDHWLDPQVRRLLGVLDRAVACGLSRSEFQRRVAVIVQLKPTMPVAWRKAEAVLARDDGTPARSAWRRDHQPLAEDDGGVELARLAEVAWDGDGSLQLHAPGPADTAPRRRRDGGGQ
jgi:hypothetical protein